MGGARTLIARASPHLISLHVTRFRFIAVRIDTSRAVIEKSAPGTLTHSGRVLLFGRPKSRVRQTLLDPNPLFASIQVVIVSPIPPDAMGDGSPFNVLVKVDPDDSYVLNSYKAPGSTSVGS